MSSALRWMMVLAVVLVFADGSFAQTTEVVKTTEVVRMPNLGPGIGMGLSILGLGVGLGLIGFAALSGIARQPEQAKNIQSVMILLAALVEGAAIISLVLCLVTALLG